MVLPRFDPFSRRFRQDPFAVYQTYREAGPVHWGKPANPGLSGAWYVFSHEAVRQTLRSADLGREAHRAGASRVPAKIAPLMAHIDRWVMFRDPPYHGRLRAALAPAFQRKHADALSKSVSYFSDGLAKRCRRAGTFDVMADFATPLTRAALSEFSGIAHDRLQEFQPSTHALSKVLDLKRDPRVYDFGAQAALSLERELRAAISAPGNDQSGGLLTHLRSAVASECLTEEEAVSTMMLVLVTGQETTRNLICNGALALFGEPVSLLRKAGKPESAKALVEELMRLVPPVHMSGRVAKLDIEIAGTPIRRGEPVVACLAAANRDPTVYDMPDRLDLNRSAARSMTFGDGIHVCIGQWMARATAMEAFRVLLPMLPDITPMQRPQWRDTILFRSLEALPVRLGAAK